MRGGEPFSKHRALAVVFHWNPVTSVFHTLLVCTLIVVMCAVRGGEFSQTLVVSTVREVSVLFKVVVRVCVHTVVMSAG